MSLWLLIISVIYSSVTYGDFPIRFLKCSFHKCIRSSWRAAFSLALPVLFLLLTSFTVCHAILGRLSSTESLILLIQSCIYSVCSFRYALVSSPRAFLNFWTLALLGFLLLHRDAVFTSSRFFLSTNFSLVTLCYALCLRGMNSAAASMRELTNFSYSSFGVRVSGISWSASNVFLSVIVYLSQIYLLLSRDQS